MERYDEAIAIYRNLLSERNEKTIINNLNNALVSRAHELVKDGESEDAIAMFKEAIKGGYSDGYVYYGLAKAYSAKGNNTKAAENYEKAIALDPDKTQYSADYSEFISSVYKTNVEVKSTGSKEELPSINLSVSTPETKEKPKEQKVSQPKPAEKTSDTAKKKSQDFIAEGDKNYKNNKYDAAIKNYQDSLQLIPEDAETLLKIGSIYQVKGDTTKAVNFYQKAIIVNPDYTDGWFNLGLAYAKENNLIESQKSFEKVIELDGNYNSGYAYYALAIAMENQGKKSEAVKNYKSFIKHSQDKDLINSVQDKIKQLQ